MSNKIIKVVNPRPNSETSVNGICSAKGLTAKQQLFVHAFMVDPNGTKAATVAGYKNPERSAVMLLNGKDYPKVADAIKEVMAQKREAAGIEAKHIVDELAKIGFSNVKRLFDDKSNLIPINELPDDVACIIKEFDVSQKVGMGADGKPTKIRTVRVKLHDKLNALMQLAQHLGFLKDVSSTTVNNTIVLDWGGMTKRREVVDVVAQRIAEQEGKSLPAGDTYTTPTNDEE